ncbi:uncharacterized protein LY79DRAFT_24294 [Colletotrichum navitas]|uniref:Uncharacterized protein n=1 Tax=Colletotrichum navitas TaxID=681940 RepID=A0AAD8QFM5_9PEZI|nr:uncharacterized protein LY79DRAFT_24294 [Colletotrichum navitas]KAK1600567.1 hypothetical protein LY79DRAFT_24294 [Colletotrichum navitas]
MRACFDEMLLECSSTCDYDRDLGVKLRVEILCLAPPYALPVDFCFLVSFQVSVPDYKKSTFNLLPLGCIVDYGLWFSVYGVWRDRVSQRDTPPKPAREPA